MLSRLDASRGLAGTGFRSDDLAALLERTAPAAPEPDDLDGGTAPPPAGGSPRTRKGDMWVLGPHRLLVGSATVPGDVDRLLGDDHPDLILTDPPYCSGGFQESGRGAGSIGTNAKAAPQIANDRLSTRGYRALISQTLAAVDVPVAYVFTDWRMWVNLFDVMEGAGYGVRSMIVWDKGSPGMGLGWRAQHELVMFASKAPVGFDRKASALGNVRTHGRTGNPHHPTQKPVDLLAEILGNTPGKIVYDPFSGSGSTVLAGAKTGRIVRAMELDPRFADATLDRWVSTPGRSAHLDGTEKAWGPDYSPTD